MAPRSLAGPAHILSSPPNGWPTFAQAWPIGAEPSGSPRGYDGNDGRTSASASAHPPCRFENRMAAPVAREAAGLGDGAGRDSGALHGRFAAPAWRSVGREGKRRGAKRCGGHGRDAPQQLPLRAQSAAGLLCDGGGSVNRRALRIVGNGVRAVERLLAPSGAGRDRDAVQCLLPAFGGLPVHCDRNGILVRGVGMDLRAILGRRLAGDLAEDAVELGQ